PAQAAAPSLRRQQLVERLPDFGVRMLTLQVVEFLDVVQPATLIGAEGIDQPQVKRLGEARHRGTEQPEGNHRSDTLLATTAVVTAVVPADSQSFKHHPV